LVHDLKKRFRLCNPRVILQGLGVVLDTRVRRRGFAAMWRDMAGG
jgi:hypothetical protein